MLVRPKAGILDPQGIAVERALPALGFDGVSNVHVGRLIELDVENTDELPAMCERLLANPLIEEYEIQYGHAIVAEPAGIASAFKQRYGDVVDRLSFYAPYKADPATWLPVLEELQAD